ncbi:MAG TPA: endonuclease/exonuclease/phosphatase family protein [Chloroflexota bacterium]|nr:endonuclease/exonuclease/phosphatase family protein [Chloroflexota bacterium]
MRRLPKRGPLAGAARVVASLYVAGLLLWALLHALFGDRYWWTFLLNTFALYLFVPLPAVMLVMLLSGSALAWLPTSVAVAMWAYLYGSLFVPRGSAPADNETAMTVMTFNLLAYNAHPERVIAALRASDADVIGLQELNPGIARAIERDLGHAYPYQVLAPASTKAAGMGVISRYPLHPTSEHLAGTWIGPPQILALELGHTRVTVLNLHPVSTLLATITLEYRVRQREETAQELVRYVRAHPGPLIVTTDFNAGDQSTAYATVTRVLGDCWREAGWGFGHTFPGALSPGSSRPVILGIPVPMWLLRIDYIFHSRDWRTRWARIGPWDGVSDHRPVLARLVLSQDTGTHA